jgi:hypothetical protein
MPLLSEQITQQLTERFAETLRDPVHLTLYTRPGSGRLVLPGGLGCATCDDARAVAEELVAVAPDLLTLDVVDVSTQDSEVTDVPTLTLNRPGAGVRISWQGLPAGFEFATVVDAIERASNGQIGLTQQSTEALGRLTEPVEVLVFATPT